MWIHAVLGRTMMWLVMRITVSTMQLLRQLKELITLDAKETESWLTTSCTSTLVSFQCFEWSEWYNHCFLRETSSGSCSLIILNTKLNVPNIIILMILKQNVLLKLDRKLEMNGQLCPSWCSGALKEWCHAVDATFTVYHHDVPFRVYSAQSLNHLLWFK